MKKFLKLLVKIGIAIVSLMIIVFMLLIFWINSEVNKVVKESQKIYKQEKLVSMIMMLEDEQNDLKKRNSVVWALGQIGDKKALSVLERLYTGEKCDHKKYLCQYELKKAIKKINGEINIAKVFYFFKD